MTMMPTLITINRNGNFGLVFGWGEILSTHIHDFSIPLDFLGIKKNEKKANFF